MSNIVFMGAGRHMTDKLVPSLLKLQQESTTPDNKIQFIGIVRNDISKGGIKGLETVPLYKSLDEIPLDMYNIIIACGPPSLHILAINYAIKHKKKCFVEKPHIVSVKDLNFDKDILKDSMIGYNFNFMPFLADIDIKDIIVGTKGIYMDWGDIFPKNIIEYMYCIHSVIVHPISILVQKYGAPNDVIVKAYKIKEDVDIHFTFKYNDCDRFIHFTSASNEFFMNIRTNKEGELYECKKYKSDTYYHMLKYFLSTNDIKINSFDVGNIVINVIDKCATLLMEQNK